MESVPKFLIIPNKNVESYAEVIRDCISKLNLRVSIDTRYELKLKERMENSEEFIVIAVGPKNRDAQTLQIRLENQIQIMTFENFIKFTLVLTHTD